MMLTGRVYQADEGERVGFAQYLVPKAGPSQGARTRAARGAERALDNYALMHALPRIADTPADQGFLTEADAAIAQSAPGQARWRLPRSRAAKVGKNLSVPAFPPP